MAQRPDAQMPNTFGTATLTRFATATEVAIRTSCRPDRAVIIWVVVVGTTVFARSFRGQRGQWYVDLTRQPAGILELEGTRWPIHAMPVTDSSDIAAVSHAYLTKYATSPYAKEMVRGEILDTTLRLDPA